LTVCREAEGKEDLKQNPIPLPRAEERGRDDPYNILLDSGSGG
jgi:hypothetical protein